MSDRERARPHRAPPSEAPEVTRLRRAHRELDEQIRALDRRRYLSDAEALGRRELQKRKLSVRDRLLALGAVE